MATRPATDAAFARAAHVTKIDLINNRLVPNAMEPRAAIGQYDLATGDYTLYTTSQNPHVIRLLMGAFVLSIPEHKLRVYAPDVGGGFGSKIFHYAEEAFVTWASARVGRPIKWVAERTESFMSDAHGRDHVTHAEMAFDANGKVLALKAETLANMGAYLSTFAPCVPTWLHGTLLAGQYTTPAVYCNVKAVFTNTVPVDAYRGAGRPEATYILERLMSKAAQEMGVDQAELRRKNFIQPNQFPYQTPVAVVYDTGDYETALNEALKLSDYAAFPQRRAAAKAKGKLRGIGVASYIEACGIAPSSLVGALGARAGLYEAATVRVNPTGSVTVLTGSHSHGQGHETTFAQVVADKLGIDARPGRHRAWRHGQSAVRHGHLRLALARGRRLGNREGARQDHRERPQDRLASSRSLRRRHRVRERRLHGEGHRQAEGVRRDRAHGLCAAQIPDRDPRAGPRRDRVLRSEELHLSPPAPISARWRSTRRTGMTEIVSFTAADDFGNVVNPMIVEGQVHGGLAQGIGQALLENTVYDENGQLLTGSFMDYCMPRADDLPKFKVHTLKGTPCTHNPLGVKGCGEAGAIGSPPAVINAIVDALKEFGVDHMDMPATPEKVWRAINTRHEESG